MAHDNTQPYAVKGNLETEQAESSTANRGGGTTQIRVLAELQLISYLLATGFGIEEDLAQLRQDVVDSIT